MTPPPSHPHAPKKVAALRKPLVQKTTKVAPEQVAIPRGASNHDLLASNFLRIYRASPLEIHNYVRAGVTVQDLDAIAEKMGVPKKWLTEQLDLPASTLRRRSKVGLTLPPDQSERVLGMARLIGKAEATILESGNSSGFDAAKWVARWLEQPASALGFRAPKEFMATHVGQGMVSQLIDQIVSGVCA